MRIIDFDGRINYQVRQALDSIKSEDHPEFNRYEFQQEIERTYQELAAYRTVLRDLLQK